MENLEVRENYLNDLETLKDWAEKNLDCILNGDFTGKTEYLQLILCRNISPVQAKHFKKYIKAYIKEMLKAKTL